MSTTVDTTDVARFDRAITEALGRYNGHVSWYLRQSHTPSAAHVADMLEERDGRAVEFLVGMKPWSCDRQAWRPVLEARCLELVAELRPDAIG